MILVGGSIVVVRRDAPLPATLPEGEFRRILLKVEIAEWGVLSKNNTP
ncbi:MAG: hypothetical protein KAF91_26330 [Nostoc sp. TH1S01]|nr:hypothetical protein [Nostoc sp. TH1S01]